MPLLRSKFPTYRGFASELLPGIYSEQMLRFHETPRTVKNAERIDAWSNLGEGVLSNNYAKDPKVLTDEEIRYIELRCFDLMNLFGYAPAKVEELPAEEALSQEVAELEQSIRPGSYQLADAEKAIRDRRLAHINDILDRKPVCPMSVR